MGNEKELSYVFLENLADFDFLLLDQCYVKAPSGPAAGEGPQVTRIIFSIISIPIRLSLLCLM